MLTSHNIEWHTFKRFLYSHNTANVEHALTNEKNSMHFSYISSRSASFPPTRLTFTTSAAIAAAIRQWRRRRSCEPSHMKKKISIWLTQYQHRSTHSNTRQKYQNHLLKSNCACSFFFASSSIHILHSVNASFFFYVACVYVSMCIFDAFSRITTFHGVWTWSTSKSSKVIQVMTEWW